MPAHRIFVCVNEKAPEKAQCLKGEGEKCVLWLREEVKKRGLSDKIWVTKTRCQDYCEPAGTALCFEPVHTQFSGVKVEDLAPLLEEFLKTVR